MARVVVCVTRQISCERLILAGAGVVDAQGGKLSVVHVAANGHSFLDNDKEGEALEYLYAIAKQNGADIAVLRSENVTRSLVKYARTKRATHVILGVTGLANGAESGIAVELQRQLRAAHVVTVPA